ncbi:conserved hypothetical protein [Pyrenophora tritici-repentis Pt-1C-BFP]|uniref:Rhodopsin domain-containing protein n=1 Tax=Pyrenophora tritici-repentis (strain Pt-1C-BFP) TaxID=426418 RepID=B2WH33_PYRTR|nr:uncharacterized protein PTRG_09292 [Pyrenophora tritici-repentis Pt-1C-BFP]EDU42343.1 conserved hypothetical protein [Pyrenophora tritici-repentis Pt-1C-BFP]
MAPSDIPTSLPSPELIAYSNAHNLIAEAATLCTIAVLTVILRCYARAVVIKSFGYNDWTMILASVMAIATLVCILLQVPLGLGKYTSVIQMDPVKYQHLLKIRYAHQIICNAAVTIVKISVAFFLLRFATIWACLPIEASWNFSLRPPPLGNGTARCFSKRTFGDIALFNAMINCLTDFLLALLPVTLIWQLSVNLRTRISLIAILSLGIFVGAAGAFRATAFNTILKDPRRFVHDKWMMWNYVELTVGIIAGSLPALKPLFVRMLKAAREKTAMGSGTVSAHARLSVINISSILLFDLFDSEPTN